MSFFFNVSTISLKACCAWATAIPYPGTIITEEAFFIKRIDGIPIRFYRTGDSCYFDEEGDIILAGRIDHQVKIQGYRIELGEVEFHARKFLEGQNTIACSYDNDLGIAELALFIEGPIVEKNKLLKYLKNKLPHYMIPSKVLVESAFPINTSGKVDRMLLKDRLVSKSWINLFIEMQQLTISPF